MLMSLRWLEGNQLPGQGALGLLVTITVGAGIYIVSLLALSSRTARDKNLDRAADRNHTDADVAAVAGRKPTARPRCAWSACDDYCRRRDLYSITTCTVLANRARQ